MKELSEKLLLVAAGAAVGALGYLAWKNRDELHGLLDKAMDKGQELFEQQVQEMSNMAAAAKSGEKE